MKEIGLFLVLACFWNLENYYHPSDDPQTADEDFTPAGSYHWTYGRFNKKRDDIAKTILSIQTEENGAAFQCKTALVMDDDADCGIVFGAASSL